MNLHCVSLAVWLALGPTASNAQAPVQPMTTTSSGQVGGVTAGQIGTVNQVLPALVRGPKLEAFKESFATGAGTLRMITRGDLTDEQYVLLFKEADRWFSDTQIWLLKDFNSYVMERFLFVPAYIRVTYQLSGDRAPGIREQREIYINSLSRYVQNLDALMREPSIYPEAPVAVGGMGAAAKGAQDVISVPTVVGTEGRKP